MGKLTDFTTDRVMIDPRGWCHEQNIKSVFERMDRWFYLGKVDNREQVLTLDGVDAANVRKLLDGTLLDFEGWEPDQMAKHRRWLRHVAEMGLRPQALAA